MFPWRGAHVRIKCAGAPAGVQAPRLAAGMGAVRTRARALLE